MPPLTVYALPEVLGEGYRLTVQSNHDGSTAFVWVSNKGSLTNSVGVIEYNRRIFHPSAVKLSSNQQKDALILKYSIQLIQNRIQKHIDKIITLSRLSASVTVYFTSDGEL